MAFHDIPPHTPQWHAMRARHLGASEIAALLDAEAPYALSRFALHHVKAGTVEPPPVDNERVRMGLALEPVIGRLAAERHDWTITPGRYATDDACPGLGASLDFECAPPAAMPSELEGCTGPGVLETKNVAEDVFRKAWVGGEPPVHQLLQLQSQLACSGYQWGCLAALIGGNVVRTVFYRPRPRIIATIRARTAKFWLDVHEGRAPLADGSDNASTVIRALFPELAWEPLDLTSSNTLPGTCADFLAADADYKEAKKRRDELRNQVMAEVGGYRTAITTGFNVSIAVTPEKPDAPAPLGYLIPGKAEVRRLVVKERVNA